MEKQWGSLSYFPRATQRFPDTSVRPRERTAAATERQLEKRPQGTHNWRTRPVPKEKRPLRAEGGRARTGVRFMKARGWAKNEEIQEQTFVLFSPPTLPPKLREGACTPLHAPYWHRSSSSKSRREEKPASETIGRKGHHVSTESHTLPPHHL